MYQVLLTRVNIAFCICMKLTTYLKLHVPNQQPISLVGTDSCPIHLLPYVYLIIQKDKNEK